MAHELSPQFRAILNLREPPAFRAERLWALHAEMTTPQGLRHAAFWLPTTWPHLLQLLSDPHPEVRTAAVHLLGHLGAVLAGLKEPSLVGRMPSSALLDWGLALLSPASTLPVAQRMTAVAKESALMALYVCVAAMSPHEVAPFAQPLLRLTMAILEATTTPPRLLGPLLRLLLAVLPAVPLATLGQGFGDLADLLCGWALEPLVASDDRQFITLILHALRPQWHSHPDFTASLTENMLEDVKSASTSTAAAVAEGSADAVAQATACMQLLQLLCDIFSAASLRQLPISGLGSVLEDQAPPLQQDSKDRLRQQSVATQTQVPPGGPQAQAARAAAAAELQAVQMNKMHHQPNQQQHQQHGPALMSVTGSVHGNAQSTALPKLPKRTAPPPLALTAILPTRPGAATVQHLIGLFPRLLTTLKEIRNSFVRLGEISSSELRSSLGTESWAMRVCGCVEILADSVSSCVMGIDPRDIDELWEGFGDEVLGRLAKLPLHERNLSLTGTAASQDMTAVVPARIASAFKDGLGSYGPVGAVARTATSSSDKVVSDVAPLSTGLGAFDCSTSDDKGLFGGSRQEASERGPDAPSLKRAGSTDGTPNNRGRGATLRLWTLQAALEWALSLLSGLGDGQPGLGGRRWGTLRTGPGSDTEALLGFMMKLLSKAVDHDSRCLLVQLVIEGQGANFGVCSLRSCPQASSIAAAAKLLQALLSHEHKSVAMASLEWLLEDLQKSLAALQPQGSRPSVLPAASQPFQSSASASLHTTDCVEGSDAAAAAAFGCAVLQAACQRGFLSGDALLCVEAVAWNALRAATLSHAQQAFTNLAAVAQQHSAPVPAVSQSDDNDNVQVSGDQEGLVALGKSGTSDWPMVAPMQLCGSVQQRAPLPSSVAFALCDTWASAALALITDVWIIERKPAQRLASEVANPVSADTQPGLTPGSTNPRMAQQSSAGSLATAVAATHACSTVYLRVIQTLQTRCCTTENGMGSGLQLRAMMALQLLLKHPAVAASGALRCEQLFRLAVEVASAGASSWDARIRTAAINCATDLVSIVQRQQPLPPCSASGFNIEEPGPLLPGPPQVVMPRLEAFLSLIATSLDAMVDSSADVAAAAARLAMALSEAALLTTLRGPAAGGTWVPVWQDVLAVTPAKRLPRVQQVARLLELVFQSSVSQGSVLLRKRTPHASAAGPGVSDDGDTSGRIEALQRLALSMLPVEAAAEQRAPGNARDSLAAAVGEGVASATDELATGSTEGRSGAALVWLALQEGAKHMVSSRLRTHLGGPTQTLGALERMLQATYLRLCKDRRNGRPMDLGAAERESAWLVLEMLGALERAVAHAAEGHGGRDVLAQPVLAFFAANKKVCEEWFTRGRELLARISSMASAHHHTVYHGLLRLRDLCGTMRQLLVSLAKERGKAAAAGAASKSHTDTQGGDGSSGGPGSSQVTAGPAASPVSTASAALADLPPQSGAPSTSTTQRKQLQRRGGAGGETAPALKVQVQQHPQQHQQQQSSATAVDVATVGAGAVPEEPSSARSAAQQLEDNLSRLALAVLEVLKLVGAALLAMGEAESLQGLHVWAVREFEPLLLGAHLSGASAVAAATASMAADGLASSELGLSGTGSGSTQRRKLESMRATRSGSKQQKDAFAWLLGLSLQAAGSYEQALVSYNAFLAPTQAPTVPDSTGSPGASLAPTSGSPGTALELVAAAQGFVVERVAECYASLTDWSGLQDLVSAFSQTTKVGLAVAGWWPEAAAAIEHRFRALEAFDTATITPAEAMTGDPNAVMLAVRQALDRTADGTQQQVTAPAASAVAASPARLQPHADLGAVREVAHLELGRQMERLRASALYEPTSQKELFLQISCLRSALRALDQKIEGQSVDCKGPWAGLLLPKVLHAVTMAGKEKGTIAGTRSAYNFGLGRALLTPDGGLITAIVRDVAVTSSLLRPASASDPRLRLPETQALSVEHIRAAAATGNWSLAIRLVQAAAARLPDSGVDRTIGGGAVLSVAHSLLSAASGRLMPGQVVELQLRSLLPHLAPSAEASAVLATVASPAPVRPGDVDSDDIACALCTLARWMLKAGAATSHHHHHHHLHVASSPQGPQQQKSGIPQPATSQRQQPSSTNSVAPGRHLVLQPPAGSGSPPGFPRNALQQSHQSHQNHQHQHQQEHQTNQQHTRPGFAGANAISRSAPITTSASAQWLRAADWPALSSLLQRQLVVQHPSSPILATSDEGVPAPSAHLAFLVPELLLQSCTAPAACCLRALQLSPRLPRAWKAWGDLLFKATKEHRARTVRPPLGGSSTGNSSGPDAVSAAVSDGPAGPDPNDTSGAWAAVGFGAAAVAYCRYLVLSYNYEAAVRQEDVLPVLLQLLHIIVRHATSIEQLLETQLAAVSPLAWSTITPQLLAQLPSATGAARRLLGLLLHTVGRAMPSLVLYPAVVEVRAADAAATVAAATSAAIAAVALGDGSGAGIEPSSMCRSSASMVPELRALLADLDRSCPGLLTGVEVLVAEMERLTVLWDERWAALLAEVEVEIARRAVSLQAEASRIGDDASLTAEQRQALLSSRYSTLMAPAVMLLERQLRATAAMPPETPHERWFAAAMLPRLRAATASLRDGSGVRDWARPNQAWAPLRGVANALARQQRQSLPPMAELAPRLAALQGSDVPMPGFHKDDDNGSSLIPVGLLRQQPGAHRADGHGAVAWGQPAATVTVAGVSNELVALNTKTRPKRVALLGSDGRMYTYLLKGREDLRMDERLMQVLRAVNVMLQADPVAATRGLATVRCYSVTPLGPRAGLIQWVPATTSLFGVFRQWQAATLERHAAMVAARQEGVVKALSEGTAPPPEVEPPPPAAISRPMDLFYSALVAALQERGLSSATPRRNWPADLLRAVFTTLASSAPKQLLARVLWAGGGSAALAWRRQQRYSRSVAVMSCVGHLLGLGDRHPDNILLEGREAGVVHIDYNVCWDKGAKLRVPEVVPFRLTQMLSTALGIGGLEGTFRSACEVTLACLRRRREALVALVDAVLSDPGVDWAVEREDMAARQDMELAVALNLFVSRAEEGQRQLQQAEEDLPALLEGPVGVLLSYMEAQAFAEAMRSAAAEAQQRIQQAKSAMEASNRVELEASAIVAAAAQEAASLAAEGNALSNAVPQLLQQCGAWAQQHAGTLGVLREGSFLEGTFSSGASWRAVESGCALGLLAPVQGPGHASLTAAAPLALLPAVMGGDGMMAIGQLPEEVLLSCHECDRQAADVLGRREAALCDAVASLTQYGTIVRKLLSPAYPTSSYHHCWAQALAALAAGGLSMPAVMQAQALAPREPRPLDVATAWQALRGAQRLATAAAIVLAPDSQDATVAMSGYLAGARVSGRELAAAVAATCKALGDALAGVVADAQVRAQERQAALAATTSGPVRTYSSLSGNHFTQGLVELLQRRERGDGVGGEGVNGGGSTFAGPIVAAASGAMLRLVRAASQRIEALTAGSLQGRKLHPSQVRQDNLAFAEDGAVVQDFLRLNGEVAGLAAVTAALAEAQLAEQLFGSENLGCAVNRGCRGSSNSLLQYHRQHNLQQQQGGSPIMASRAATPVLFESSGAAASRPLPWLAAAMEGCSRWAELMQRLAADVAPELAGQLHVGSSGCGGGINDPGGGSVGGNPAVAPLDTPFVQAMADFHVLLRPVEEALQAGRDAHARLEALAELTATYHDRRADLMCRLAVGDAAGTLPTSEGNPALSTSSSTACLLSAQERESLEADLQALDAAWTSRDGVAASLSSTAAMATDALAVALRFFYAAVLGPGLMPGELQGSDGAAAAFASAPGMEGWTEAGGSGHAAVAALVAWWDAVTEALQGIQHYNEWEVGTVLDAGDVGIPGPAGSLFEAPPTMRPLWRCVEVAYLVEQSLRTCSHGVRLTAPAGTDSALAEAYSAVMQALMRRATEHAITRFTPYLRHFLNRMRDQLLSALEISKSTRPMSHSSRGSIAVDAAGSANEAINGGGGDRGGVGAFGGIGPEDPTDWAAGAAELVPFTDFDADVAGEGELLGGLEDGDGKGADGDEDGNGASWLAYDEAPEDREDGDDGENGYDLDLGLDLDLDDGFGGGSEDVDDGRRSGGGGLEGNSQDRNSFGEGDLDARSRHASQGVRRTTTLLPPASVEEISAAIECLAACAAAASIESAAAAVDPSAQLQVTTASATSWAAWPEARATRARRLQRLAAYEWMHEHHLLQALPSGDPRVGQALAQFFAAQAADPLQPSTRVTSASRLALLTQLQSALDALPQLEQGVSCWEAASGAAVSQIMGVLSASPERYPVDTALAAQRAGMLMGRRQQWLMESGAVVMRVCQVAEALLQFEYSRQGITWSSGGAAVADGFVAHCQLLGRAEVLATLAAGGSEAGRAAAVAEASQRAAEAAMQAADARYALEMAQYEEVAASSQLQAHLPQLVSRSLDLAAAVAEAEPVVKGLVNLLSIKLGPALKELSSVTAQHSAASDVASVAAAVMVHFKRSHQAAEALAAALPAIVTSLAAADAAAPLPADMATEVGFLSAQLLGGQAAATETSKRAMALLQHMAAPATALQPVVHNILELPRALGQLSNELSTLAAAAGSIAAAVESKHLLPALYEQPQQGLQQQGRAETQTPPQGSSAGQCETLDDAVECSAVQAASTAADADAIGTSSQDGTSVMPSTFDPGSLGPAAGRSEVKVPAALVSAAATKTRGPVRPPLHRSSHAATGDHLQHHRSRRSAADEARRRAFAVSALRRFIGKLEGRESDCIATGPMAGSSASGLQQQHLPVPDQVDLLIRQATSVERWSQMYEGWAAWL